MARPDIQKLKELIELAGHKLEDNSWQESRSYSPEEEAAEHLKAQVPDLIAYIEELEAKQVKLNRLEYCAYDLWDCSSKIEGDIRQTGLWEKLAAALSELGHTR